MSMSQTNRERGRITGLHVLVAMLAFFALVIAVNTVFAVLAVRSFPGVEVHSSFKAGNEYGRVIAASEAQASRGWRVEGTVTRDAAGRASVRFEPHEAGGARIGGLAVTLTLKRPADGRGDVALTLEEGTLGIYAGRVADLAPGQWDALFEARRGNEVLYRSRNRIVLR